MAIPEPGCCDTQYELIRKILIGLPDIGMGDGVGLVATNFVYNEIPTGAVDGVNAVFTLADAPVAGKQSVFLDGVKQDPNAASDYTIAGAVITFTVAPMVGTAILADYIKP